MNSTPEGTEAQGGPRGNNVEARTLLVGIGNEFRRDDGAGILAVRRIKERHLSQVEIVETSGEGTALMEAWNSFSSVVLVDAVASGKIPGTIHRLDLSRATVPKQLHLFSTHAFGVVQAVELARSMGSLPRAMILLGVEAENFSQGVGFSPLVEVAMAGLEKVILEELSKLILSSRDIDKN